MYIEEYYTMSCHIANEIPSNFEEYFSNQLGNLELMIEIKKNMDEWLLEASSLKIKKEDLREINMQTFIWYILSTSESLENYSAAEHRAKFHSLKRDRKRHLYKIIKEEYNGETLPRNPHYLEQNTDIYFSVMNNNPDIKQYNSKEEYKAQRFKEVEEWYQDSNSDICKFLFFNSISPKRKAKYLELDIGYRIYDLIVTSYYGNPVDGYLTRTPKEAVNIPAFSMVSKENNLQYSMTDTLLTIYDDYADESGLDVKTVVDEIPGNYTTIIEQGGQEEYVRQMILNQTLYPGIKLLDATDSALLTAINSMFNLLDINRGQKTIPLSSLCGIAYSDTRQKYYLQTIQHLDRLAHYRINYTRRDMNNKITRVGTMSFFDIDYQISESETPQKYTSITVSDSSGNVSLIEELDGYDLRNVKVSVQPSQHLKEAWKNHMNIKILTSLYDKVTQPKAKMLLMYLQSERTDKYPITKLTIPLTTLAEQLRLSHMRKNKIREIINASLEALSDNKIIVKSYNVAPKIVSIEFFPITDQEKEYYQLTEEDTIKVLEANNEALV